MKGYLKYLGRKLIWYLFTFVIALLLNFFLPRLIPGNPVQLILGEMAAGMTDTNKYMAIYNEFMESFGLNLPLWRQFIRYVENLFQGDLGRSFTLYPATVTSLIASRLPYTLAIQLPSIIVGWVLGNLLGAVAAYKKGVYDKVVFPVSLLVSSIPSFILSFVLLFVLGMQAQWFPLGNAYSPNILPSFVHIGFITLPSWEFFSSLLYHWTMPFLSTVIVMIGGQAIGMRSMSLYELNADYVLYAKLLGIRDKKITRYVFRNAVLPQVTGLALSIGSCVGGALIVEIVFSYPGIGSLLYQSIRNIDYTLLSGCTLMISSTVLIANFLVELVYGILDPRVRSAHTEES
ncbi:MAG: ABC transporter permease [Eubacteriales bacterium]|nr:ABC transporter permease [Eubacteriales bacterium]